MKANNKASNKKERNTTMLQTVICYKTIQPIVYNKGTKYECSDDEFLAFYTGMTLDQAKAYLEEVNATHAETWLGGSPVKWDNVAYYFADEQEPFEG